MAYRLVLLLASAYAMSLGGCSSRAAVQDSGSDVILYRLGSGRYVVTSVPEQSDGCHLGAIAVGAAYDLVLDNSTGRASLTEAGAAAGCTAALGCGTISDNQGTLTTSIVSLPATACTSRKMITSVLTLVNDLKFSLAVTHEETERVGCSDPPDATCTSTFTLLLERQSSGA